MKKNTLLEKAKQSKIKKQRTVPNINDENHELGLAYAKGEINLEQVKMAMG